MTTNQTQFGNEYSRIFYAKIKDNNDIMRMGRLKVWIPELSNGQEDDENSWILVNYCSPFAGASNIQDNTNETSFEGSQKSYGFWAVPPDVNNYVLVVFANGNPSMGFWIGCIYQEFMNHMVPGIPINNDRTNPDPSDITPRAEYNRRVDQDNYHNPDRPEYTPLYEGLIQQGVENDPVRGYSTSGARRIGDNGEDFGPANVYGMLTPKGHQFVMDDGNSEGDSSLIRLRTRSGAQILISESTGIINLMSRDGKSYIELTNDGHVDIYGMQGINFHSESSDFNIHSRGNINFQAEGGINLNSRGGDVRITSNVNLQITSGTNTFITTGNDFHLRQRNLYSLSGNDTHIVSSNNLHEDTSGTHYLRAPTLNQEHSNVFIASDDVNILNSGNISLETSNLNMLGSGAFNFESDSLNISNSSFISSDITTNVTYAETAEIAENSGSAMPNTTEPSGAESADSAPNIRGSSADIAIAPEENALPLNRDVSTASSVSSSGTFGSSSSGSTASRVPEHAPWVPHENFTNSFDDPDFDPGSVENISAPANELRSSDVALFLIASYEGFMPYAYEDNNSSTDDRYAIGYGWNNPESFYRSGTNPNISQGVTLPLPTNNEHLQYGLTEQEAWNIFSALVDQQYGGFVRNTFGSQELTQFQFDALTSLAYNGPIIITGSRNNRESIRDAIRERDFERAAFLIEVWPQHRERRAVEADLFRGNLPNSSVQQRFSRSNTLSYGVGRARSAYASVEEWRQDQIDGSFWRMGIRPPGISDPTNEENPQVQLFTSLFGEYQDRQSQNTENIDSTGAITGTPGATIPPNTDPEAAPVPDGIGPGDASGLVLTEPPSLISHPCDFDATVAGRWTLRDFTTTSVRNQNSNCLTETSHTNGTRFTVDDLFRNLQRTANSLLIPIETAWGRELYFTSVYRNPEVNVLVGSTATNSFHKFGMAADVKMFGVDLAELATWLRNESRLQFHQCILEYYNGGDGSSGGWLHLAYAPDFGNQRLCWAIGGRTIPGFSRQATPAPLR